jgi:hypothetical protein
MEDSLNKSLLKELIEVTTERAVEEEKKKIECQKQVKVWSQLLESISKNIKIQIKIYRLLMHVHKQLKENELLLQILLKSTANGHTEQMLKAWKEAKASNGKVVIEQGLKTNISSGGNTQIKDIKEG